LGIGGPARYFIRATSERLIEEAVEFSKKRNLPLLVLGGGSNLLIADCGFAGVVVRVEIPGLEWIEQDRHVRVVAGAGEDWDKVVAQAVQRQLYGVECLSGIPGSVGGTPVQNVGAYGQEVAETLVQVRAYDRQGDEFRELDRSACQFGYRSSVFNTTARDRYIVVKVGFALRKDDRPAIVYPDVKRELDHVPDPTLAMVRDAIRRIRARKAMLIQPGDPDCRSAGSFFKNPMISDDVFHRVEVEAGEAPPRYPASGGKVKTAAAWLIQRAGIPKGFTIGFAGVSAKHTLALINKGGATAADVIKLAREIRARVEDRFGIRLAVEPVFVGFDDATNAEFNA
jgi:UDP-N-acetylmuramate dehydrogenase